MEDKQYCKSESVIVISDAETVFSDRDGALFLRADIRSISGRAAEVSKMQHLLSGSLCHNRLLQKTSNHINIESRAEGLRGHVLPECVLMTDVRERTEAKALLLYAADPCISQLQVKSHLFI